MFTVLLEQYENLTHMVILGIPFIQSSSITTVSYLLEWNFEATRFKLSISMGMDPSNAHFYSIEPDGLELRSLVFFSYARFKLRCLNAIRVHPPRQHVNELNLVR